MSKTTTVFLVLIAAVIGTVIIIFGISYFEIEPGRITESKGELSFGVTSSLGWILTLGFFVLYLLYLFFRHLYLKITGRM